MIPALHFITLNSMTCTCKQTFSIKPGFHFDFLCLLLPVLVFPATLSVFAFCCSSLLFTAFRCLSLPFVAFCCLLLLVVVLSGFSLLLMSTTFNRSRLKQMNENGKEKCSLLLLLARCCSFWFLGRVSIAFCCFSLLFVDLSCF